MKNLMLDTTEIDKTKERIREINERLFLKKQNFEKSFLIASGETLQNHNDYEQLRESVVDVIEEMDRLKRYERQYAELMSQLNILREVSRVIY